MIPVFSREIHLPAAGKYGDCFRASLCSILEISDEGVPNFCAAGFMDQTVDWRDGLRDFLNQRGVFLLHLDGEVNGHTEDWWQSWFKDNKQETAWHLYSGPSAVAGEAVLHCVVGQGGHIRHDPSDTGLMPGAWRSVSLLVPRNPTWRKG